MIKKFRLEGLCCASCAAKIEKAINELDGVKSAAVNFITTKAVIDAEDEKMSDIVAATEKIIKKIEPDAVMKKA